MDPVSAEARIASATRFMGHGRAARTMLTVLRVEYVQGIARCGNEMSEF